MTSDLATSAMSLDTLQGMIGDHIGTSQWRAVDQPTINAFADCTHDHQFIHIDPERAAQTPFGGPIAHGFLVLSLLPVMAAEATPVIEGAAMGVNYGFDKVRFVAPVPAGHRVRTRFTLAAMSEKNAGQWLIDYDVTMELEGQERPALIARWLTMQVLG